MGLLDKLFNSAAGMFNDMLKSLEEEDPVDKFFRNRENSNDRDQQIYLRYFVESYQKLYQEFKNRYDRLAKLDIGDNIKIVGCTDINGLPGDGYPKLEIALGKQEEKTIVPKGYDSLTIKLGDDFVYNIFKSSANLEPITRVYDFTTYNGAVSSAYLTLFGEYYQLFDLYSSFKKGLKTSTGVSFKIGANNDNLMNGLDYIEVYVDSENIMCSKVLVCVRVDLSDGVQIDYNKSYTTVEGKLVNMEDSYYDSILDTFVINRKDINNFNLDLTAQKDEYSK